MKEYLSVDEAAETLDVHPNTIRRWMNDGKLVAYQKGGRVLASRREIEGFIQPKEAGNGTLPSGCACHATA